MSSDDIVNSSSEESKDQLIRKAAELAADCMSCGLHESRTKVVFGVGKPTSPLMLVGEGPGASEDASGIPFVGRAGQLLDECLWQAGMKREHVYITNIVKCRACEVVEGRTNNRVPTSDEVGACVPLWLEQQIRIIQPRVIVCIGSPSANVIIHRPFRITQDRGRFFTSKYVRYAMAALHPAFILRQEGEPYRLARQTLIDDLTAAKLKAIEAKNEPTMTLF